MQPSIRVLVTDESPDMREMLAFAIRVHSDFELVGEAATETEAVAMAADRHPDVALLGMATSTVDRMRTVADIRRGAPETEVVVFCWQDDDRVTAAAAEAGAAALLGRSVSLSSLFAILRTVGARAQPGPAESVAAAD